MLRLVYLLLPVRVGNLPHPAFATTMSTMSCSTVYTMKLKSPDYLVACVTMLASTGTSLYLLIKADQEINSYLKLLLLLDKFEV